MQLITGGQTISDIQNYNVLASALMTQNVSTSWSNNVGLNMIGTSGTGAFQGLSIPAGGSATVCLPFILTALAGTTPTRYIPAFSRDALRFRFYLENQVAGLQAGGAIASTDIQISVPEAIMYVVELSPSAQQLVNAMTGGVYNILCADYRTANGSFTGTGAALTTVQTLGFSVSSLERVIVVHRESPNINTQAAQSIGARVQPTLSEYQLLINGQAFPERPILFEGTPGAGDGAETLAETLVAQHALSDFGHDSCLAQQGFLISDPAKFTLQASDGLTEAKTGTFVCAIELESMAGKSANIYSGISTIGAVVQFRGVYSAVPALAYDLAFFAQNTILLTLDTGGLGTYIVSV
jgi:hypothetical protein